MQLLVYNEINELCHEKNNNTKIDIVKSVLNPLSTRPHQNVVWNNNSWLGKKKKIWIMYQKKEKNTLQKMSPHLSQLNVATAHRDYFRRNILKILKLARYKQIKDHYFRCKLATF